MEEFGLLSASFRLPDLLHRLLSDPFHPSRQRAGTRSFGRTEHVCLPCLFGFQGAIDFLTQKKKGLALARPFVG